MNILLVARTVDCRPENTMPGSVERACSRCRHTVMLSPAADQAAGVMQLVCVQCLTPDEVDEIARTGPRLLPGQAHDIAKFMAGRN